MSKYLASVVLGYISIFFWFIVFIPQLHENYKRKSSQSLSLFFILIWILGDFFNLIGSILQDLIPTMILLAAYYCASDAVLLLQILYYRKKDTEAVTLYASEEHDVDNETNEEDVLLTGIARPNHRAAVDAAIAASRPGSPVATQMSELESSQELYSLAKILPPFLLLTCMVAYLANALWSKEVSFPVLIGIGRSRAVNFTTLLYYIGTKARIPTCSATFRMDFSYYVR